MLARDQSYVCVCHYAFREEKEATFTLWPSLGLGAKFVAISSHKFWFFFAFCCLFFCSSPFLSLLSTFWSFPLPCFTATLFIVPCEWSKPNGIGSKHGNNSAYLLAYVYGCFAFFELLDWSGWMESVDLFTRRCSTPDTYRATFLFFCVFTSLSRNFLFFFTSYFSVWFDFSLRRELLAAFVDSRWLVDGCKGL